MVGKEAAKIGKKKAPVQIIERKELTLHEKVKELENEISNTKYNKKTQHAIGLMKAKLAMLKDRAMQRAGVGKAKGDERFSVRKTGDATAILLGFPSVGKSTLLNKLTNAKSDVAAYAFTTLSAVPGMLYHKNAKIQILDVPGIVHGAASGRGRGKEVLQMVRNADLIIILVDALYPSHYPAILQEINETGVRINQKKPDVKIMKKDRGGINIGSTVPLTKTDTGTIKDICREMKIANADILIRTDIDADQLIDLIEGNCRYTKAITVITKIDVLSPEQLEELKREIKPDVCVSAEQGIGIEELKEAICNRLGFIRVYLKEVNKQPDMKEPMIMFKSSTIGDVCAKIHQDFIRKFKFARIWGKSAKFAGQVFRKLDHKLEDQDVLELHVH
jgi:small GTP-binding protein